VSSEPRTSSRTSRCTRSGSTTNPVTAIMTAADVGLELDLVLLRVPALTAPALRIAASNAPEGSEVVAAGHPASHPTTSYGRVISAEPGRTRADAAVVGALYAGDGKTALMIPAQDITRFRTQALPTTGAGPSGRCGLKAVIAR
jgi:hypothetical protein